jgi:hypothetical protein
MKLRPSIAGEIRGTGVLTNRLVTASHEVGWST